MSERLSWEQVFGPLDARTVSRAERGEYLQRRYEAAIGDREFWLTSGGEEAMWTWAAAVDAYLDGNWVAVILCCQATCERLLAGRFTPFALGDQAAPQNWQMMGMGRLLTELELRSRIAPSFASELRKMAEYRKPFGHWKALDDPMSLFRRSRSRGDDDPTADAEEASQRVVVADATHAVEVTIALLYGDT